MNYQYPQVHVPIITVIAYIMEVPLKDKNPMNTGSNCQHSGQAYYTPCRVSGDHSA